MSKSWDIMWRGTPHFLYVNDGDVVVGSGTGHTESAGSCTHAAFIAGEYNDHILEVFGPTILAEALAEAARSKGSS